MTKVLSVDARGNERKCHKNQDQRYRRDAHCSTVIGVCRETNTTERHDANNGAAERSQQAIRAEIPKRIREHNDYAKSSR
jgi:hypothetical protein